MDVLKQQARQMLDQCDRLQEKGLIYQNQPISLRECMSSEWLYFLLSLTDVGVLSTKEVAFLRDTLGMLYTIPQLHRLYVTEQLGSLEFRRKVPRSVQEFVRMDLLNKLNDKTSTFGQLAVNFFKLLGQSFIAADSSGDTASQIRRLTDYGTNLQDFLNRHSVNAILKQSDISGLAEDTPGKDAGKGPHREVDFARIDEILQELNALTGLENVKEEINSLVNLLRINHTRKERGLPQVSTSIHMVFSGNPGTGKTTVARMLAEIYYNLGVLKKNLLVEADRSALVSGYVGQTAIKSREVITSALDGVLFIDEAYTLTANKGQNDFGQEAVDTLLKMMEDNRDRLVVIVAGYSDLMEEFLESNPGLKSRFTKFIQFADYTPKQLTEIFTSMCTKQQFTLSAKAKKAVLAWFENRVAEHPANFANAREARNLYENAIVRQANRLAGKKKITDEQLMRIEDVDIASPPQSE